MLGTVRRHYEVPMTREELLERIAGSFDLDVPDWSASGVKGSRRFVGSIELNGFRIRVRKTYRNGLEPVLRCDIVSGAGATSEIETRLGPAVAARVSAHAYFISVTLVGMAMCGWGHASRLTSALVVLGLLSWGLLIVGLGTSLGRRDARELKALADDLFGPPAESTTRGS